MKKREKKSSALSDIALVLTILSGISIPACFVMAVIGLFKHEWWSVLFWLFGAVIDFYVLNSLAELADHIDFNRVQAAREADRL